MIKPETLLDVDLWEAWIEFDHLNPQYFGILYVSGEVEAGRKTGHPFFLYKVQEDKCAGILKLRFHSESLNGGRKSNEVFYSEPLININQYSSIEVYAGSKEIMRFEEIEILV